MPVGIIDFNDHRELEELDSDFLDTALETLKQEKRRREAVEKDEAKGHLQELLDEMITLMNKYHFSVVFENDYKFARLYFDDELSIKIEEC